MHSRVSHQRSALLALLLLAFTSCGGSAARLSSTPGGSTPGATAPPAPQAQAAPGAALPQLPAPASLLGLLPRQAAPRHTSYVESDCVQVGNAFVPPLPRQHEAALAGAQLSPNWVNSASSTFADLAFVTYSFSVLGYDRAPQVRLAWNVPPADFHSTWIALSRWDANRWDWYQGTADGRINLPSSAPYIDLSGQLLCLVLTTGTDVTELGSIRLGAPGPVVSFVVAPLIGAVPFNPTLDASASTAGEGTITKFEWDLDFDGVFETDTGLTAIENAMVVDNSVRTVSVRVTNSSGSKSTASQNITGVGDWTHTWGLSSVEQISAFTTDSAGNIYATGYTRAPAGPFNDDLLLMKWTPVGGLQWAVKWDGGTSDYGSQIALDSGGNLIVTGASDVTGDRQILVQQWTSGGSLTMSKCFGGPGFDSANGMFVNGTDTYIGGTTNGWSAQTDLFACRVQSDGGVVWSQARNHGEEDYGTDLEQMNFLFGPTGLIVLGEAYTTAVPNIWRVEYDLDGAFSGGYDFGTTATPTRGGQILYYYDFVAFKSHYILSGERSNGVDSRLFFTDSYGGASIYGTRWWNISAPMVTNMTYDAVGNVLVSGFMPGFDAGSIYGMIWNFDANNGDFLSSVYWNDGTVQARVHQVAPYFDGLLVTGYSPDAAGSWSTLAGNNDSFSESWSSNDGTGGDLSWSSVDAAGIVSDVTVTGTLDTGGSVDDAWLARRGAL